MKMKLKQSLFTTTLALFFGIMPLSALQSSGTQMASAAGTEHSKKFLGAETLSHPGTIAALTIKLDESFRAMSDARNAQGYVENQTTLKAHAASIKALRNGLRHHTLFAGNAEYQCGASDSQQDATLQCEQQVKSLVHDVAESFYTFELTDDQPNNPNITPTMDIGPAYLAHREALKKLADTIGQLEPTMAQAMKACF
jgi:hypothetical protein